MADSVELRTSVRSIKIVDPYVKDILATSTHVALYKFNTSSNEWERTETEGALFVYSRNGEPFHSLMIINRLNQNHLIEPIVKDFEYQMQAPFLLYRNSKGKIFGIWFYNREECVNITYVLESLMEGLKEKMGDKSKQKSPNVDIFSMLSKAQEDFNKSPLKNDSQPQFSSTPRGPDGTSQSVMDFFAKAGSKNAKPPVPSHSEGEFLLQRLMSNPEHTVEHIEKQQRSITPQDQVVVRKKSIGTADRRSVPISFSNSLNLEKKPENGFNFINITSGSPQQSFMLGSSPLSTFLMQPQSTAYEEREIDRNSPLANMLETPQKPALLAPMMFTTPSSVNKDKNELPAFSRNMSFPEQPKNIEPLTKNQMIQALSYLLKHDQDFVNKLHDAYVKSIAEMVSSTCNNSLL